MNKANELHHMADNHQAYQEQFDEILKLCAKSAFSGFYNCVIHKDRLKGAEGMILEKLSEEGFGIKLSPNSDCIELSWL